MFRPLAPRTVPVRKQEHYEMSSLWQSCAVAKSDKFRQATGQLNLADRMDNCSTGQSAVAWVRKPNFGSFCCGQPFVCQVWLSSGLPEFFLSFRNCECLWSWLLELVKSRWYFCRVCDLSFRNTTNPMMIWLLLLSWSRVWRRLEDKLFSLNLWWALTFCK